MPGSSTTASKIGESPVEGLKKMYLTPAALSCATNRAPPVPCISRVAPCATAPAAEPASGAKFCAMDLAATVLTPMVVKPDTSLRLEIPLSRYCLINSFTTSSSRLFWATQARRPPCHDLLIEPTRSVGRHRIALRLALVDDQELDGARGRVALVLVAMDGAARNVDGVSGLENLRRLAPDRVGDLALNYRPPLIAVVRMQSV